MAARTAAAASPANTGWKSVCPPPIKGSAGEKQAIAPNLLKKASSGPNRIDGRRTTADGMAAEKARAAEDGDERFAGNGSHAARVRWSAELRATGNMYRASLPAFDKPDLAPYLRLVPRSPRSQLSPGGGIGRRTSFRY